jgi:hypothetical protein
MERYSLVYKEKETGKEVKARRVLPNEYVIFNGREKLRLTRTQLRAKYTFRKSLIKNTFRLKRSA